MLKWIILLSGALSITACTTDPTYSGTGSSGMGTSGMGTSGMGTGSSGASGMEPGAQPKESTMPVPPAGSSYGVPPESSGSSGSSGKKPEPMPSGSGAGGIYDGGSSNNAPQR